MNPDSPLFLSIKPQKILGAVEVNHGLTYYFTRTTMLFRHNELIDRHAKIGTQFNGDKEN